MPVVLSAACYYTVVLLSSEISLFFISYAVPQCSSDDDTPDVLRIVYCDTFDYDKGNILHFCSPQFITQFSAASA